MRIGYLVLGLLSSYLGWRSSESRREGMEWEHKRRELSSGIANCYFLGAACETYSWRLFGGWGCTNNDNRKLRNDGSKKLCVGSETKDVIFTTPTYRDCTQIALMSQTPLSGQHYYIIQPNGSPSKNVITQCKFDSTHNQAYTMICYENKYKYFYGDKFFNDIGVYYTRIRFETAGDYRIKYDNTHNYRGFPLHLAALKFGSIYYFGGDCPDPGSKRSGYDCDVSSLGSTIPISEFTMGNYNDTCGSNNGVCPQYFEVDLPVPDVKLEGVSDIETLKEIWRIDNNFWYIYRFFGYYQIPDRLYPIYSSTNTITFGGIYIYIYII